MVTRLDRYVGEVTELIDSLGLRERTIIVFTSDNGPHREGGADPDFFGSYGPLRGIKRDMYEGGIRVPMIARCPGLIAEGTRTDFVSAFWDVLPTFADMAGAEVPANVDGISMLPTLFGEKRTAGTRISLLGIPRKRRQDRSPDRQLEGHPAERRQRSGGSHRAVRPFDRYPRRPQRGGRAPGDRTGNCRDHAYGPHSLPRCSTSVRRTERCRFRRDY